MFDGKNFDDNYNSSGGGGDSGSDDDDDSGGGDIFRHRDINDFFKIFGLVCAKFATHIFECVKFEK